METKELTNYMESLTGILTSDDNLKAELREEIIKRLREHDEMKRGIHAPLKIKWGKHEINIE